MKLKSHQIGVTLAELLLALAVGSVLVALAIPGFGAMAKNNRLVTETNTLIGHINLARSEAVKRALQVVLCRSADPLAPTPTCGGTAKIWTTGWIIFVDNDFDADDADGDDNSSFDAGELLLRRWVPGGSVELKSDTAGDSNLSFRTDGGNAGNPAVIAICDDRGTSRGRQITVTAVGRPQLKISAPGDEITSCAP